MENFRDYSKEYDPIPHLIIRNSFNQNELDLIWEELEFLNQPNKMLPPNKTASALDDDGEVLKKNKSVFLEELFSFNKNFSNILKINSSLLNRETKNNFCQLNFGYNSMWYANTHTTLISYYDDGDYYLPHIDASLYTCLTWFYKEPKRFCGGDFWFPKHDYKIEIENNMTVIFPSFVEHSVDEVKMETDKYGNGRYCMSMLVHMKTI